MPEDISLSDKVIIFNNNNKWIIVSINIMLSHPFIHIKNNDIIKSLILCPLTLRTILLDGTYKFYKYDSGIFYMENENNEISQIDLKGKVKIDYDDNLIEKQNKRYEVKICSLKSGLIEYPDSEYIILKKKQILTPILNYTYYINNNDIFGNEYDNVYIHPKTLIYIIQYISKSGNLKESILIGKNANKDDVTGYNIKESGLINYLIEYGDDIINKKAYLFPMLYIHAIQMYKNSIIINIK